MSSFEDAVMSGTILYLVEPITPQWTSLEYELNTSIHGDLESAAFMKSHHWFFLLLTPIIIFSVVGNVLVCVVISKVTNLQTTNNIFLVSLAVADLMVAVFVMPLGLLKDFYGFWPSSNTLCTIWATLDVFCCTSSILHITVISLDRFLAIHDPIRFHQKRRRLFSALYKIIFVWLTSATLSSPLLVLGVSGWVEVIDCYYCSIKSRRFKVYGSAVAFFIPLTVVVVTYLLTALTLHRKSRQFRRISIHKNSLDDTYHTILKSPSCHKNTETEKLAISMFPQNASKMADTCTLHNDGNIHLIRKMSVVYYVRTSNKNEQKANQVLLLIFMAFVLAWTPFFVANIIYALCVKREAPSEIFTILTWLGWASSMVNPAIYTTFNSKFRSAFCIVLSCQWNRLNEEVSVRSVTRRQYV